MRPVGEDFPPVETLFVRYNTPAIDITIGRQPLRWGPGFTGAMIVGARAISGEIARQGVPVYGYRFSYVAESIKQPGAQHASDIPFFLGTQTIKYGAATTPRDNAVGAAISDYIVNFAKTGNPNGRALPQWPRYDAKADVIMDFATDGQARAGRDPLTAVK